MTKDLEYIKRAIRMVLTVGPLEKDVGLCTNVALVVLVTTGASYSVLHAFHEAVKRWPELKNDETEAAYPIEGCHVEYLSNHDKWGDNEFGNKRRRLAQWLHDNLQDTDLCEP